MTTPVLGEFPADRLGESFRTDVRTITPEVAVEYALATNDPNPLYLTGRFAPPMVIVVPGLVAMMDATTRLLTPAMLDHAVEASHDVHLARPLVPGLELHTTASAYAIRPRRGGDRMTLRVESRDGDGALVAEQFLTMAVRGLTGSAATGPDIPGHDLPEAARARLLGSADVPFDADQTDRYAQASGDPIRIHLDDDFARSVGLPGKIGHGFCTMAMCSRAVLALAAGGDPGRLRRLAVRFRAPVFPPSTVHTRVYAGAERGVLHFEAVSGGEVVISHGLAVLG